VRILIAPDSFKETLTAAKAAEAMAAGVREVLPAATIDLCPLADGGEGTVDALVEATAGARRSAVVTGPLGEQISAGWGLLGGEETAVIEVAEAAGLVHVPPRRRDPRRTTTCGVGELMRAALDAGVGRLLVGLGGSGTTDGGAGMAQALGARFEGIDGSACGGNLLEIRSVDRSGLDRRLGATEVVAACDVTNPLLGPEGAAAVYGPQKGATPAAVEELEAGLVHFSKLVGDVDPQQPGLGAAGGLGFGLVAFCGASLRSGVDLVMEAVGFSSRVAAADLVLTGEGRIDSQTARGKVPWGVARVASEQSVATVVLAGDRVSGGPTEALGELAQCHAVTDMGISPTEAMANAAQMLQRLAARVLARRLTFGEE